MNGGEGGGGGGGKQASSEAEILARTVLQRCLDLGSRDNMTIVLADLRPRQDRQRRKVRPRQPSPSPPEAPSSSSGLASGGAAEGKGGGEGVGNDDPKEVSGGRAATTAAAEPDVGGMIPARGLDQNGTEIKGSESGSDRCLVAGAGDTGAAAAGTCALGASASGSVETSNKEPEGAGVPAPAPPAGLPVAAEVVDAEPEAGTAGGGVGVDIGAVDVDVAVGGVGGSRASSTSGALEPAAVGGEASVGEGLLKEERSGLLRLPIDGDEGVVGAAA